MSKTILVTGGLGFIGSNIVAKLLADQYNVVVLDNLSNSKATVLDDIEAATGLRPIFLEGDVRDSLFVEASIKEENVSAVIHLAGFKAVGESVENPIMYFDNNVAGLISLLDAMRNAGCFNLIFSSTAAVYGKPVYLPFDEEHPTDPESPYGDSKLICDRILQSVASCDPRWGITSLRYFNPVGCHWSGFLGDDPKGKPANLMPAVCAAVKGDIPSLSIFGVDWDTMDGSGERDYIHVYDLALGHIQALDFLKKFRGFDTFNLGTGVGVSVLKLISIFEHVNQVKVPFNVCPRRPGDVARYWANPAKAKEILKWEASQALEDMCRDSWRFSNLKKG